MLSQFKRVKIEIFPIIFCTQNESRDPFNQQNKGKINTVNVNNKAKYFRIIKTIPG